MPSLSAAVLLMRGPLYMKFNLLLRLAASVAQNYAGGQSCIAKTESLSALASEPGMALAHEDSIVG